MLQTALSEGSLSGLSYRQNSSSFTITNKNWDSGKKDIEKTNQLIDKHVNGVKQTVGRSRTETDLLGNSPTPTNNNHNLNKNEEPASNSRPITNTPKRGRFGQRIYKCLKPPVNHSSTPNTTMPSTPGSRRQSIGSLFLPLSFGKNHTKEHTVAVLNTPGFNIGSLSPEIKKPTPQKLDDTPNKPECVRRGSKVAWFDVQAVPASPSEEEEEENSNVLEATPTDNNETQLVTKDATIPEPQSLATPDKPLTNTQESTTETEVTDETETETDSTERIEAEDNGQYSSLNLWKSVQAHVAKMPMGTRRLWFKKYTNCVTGDELASYVLEFIRMYHFKYAKVTRQQSVKVCERLEGEGVVYCVSSPELPEEWDNSSTMMRVRRVLPDEMKYNNNNDTTNEDNEETSSECQSEKEAQRVNPAPKPKRFSVR
eukprot:m.345177 g.345177  ORF g.345177 m.345177 type:complete len:427 (+) comp25861_c0_seq1:77-1357(+)